MPKDLVLLRYTDDRGQKLAAMCRPATGLQVLKDIIGEASEQDEEWYDQPHKSAVVMDTSGPVIITRAEDLTMLSFWLATAATWLSQHGGGDV